MSVTPAYGAVPGSVTVTVPVPTSSDLACRDYGHEVGAIVSDAIEAGALKPAPVSVSVS